MTDISNLVTIDEAVFDLEIMGEKDGESVSTGVIFSIRDLNNVDSQRELKSERNKSIGNRVLNKVDMTAEDAGRMFSMASTDPSDKMLAMCVTGWDWNGNTFGKLDTSYSIENVIAVFDAAPWIRAQVLSKVLEITGFMKA